MVGMRRAHGFLLRSSEGLARCMPILSRTIRLSVSIGFVSLCLTVRADAASGYLKPEVNERVLKRAEGYFDEGVEFYKERNYRAALRRFTSAERACPELFSAGYHVALTQKKLGDEEAAVAQLKRLNAGFAENIIAHNDLGVMYAAKSKADSDTLAHLEFEMAIRNGESLLRGKEKKIPQVRADLAMAYANLGALQFRNEKLNDAEKSYRKSVEHYPQSFFGHFGLGNVLFSLGKFDEAKNAYRKAQQVEPNNVDVHLGLARCYLFAQDKNPRFALSELRKIKGDNLPAEVSHLFGDAYALLRDYKEAIAEYKRHLELPGRDHRVLYKLGAIYYTMGEFDQAKKCLQEFVGSGSESQKEMLSTAYKLLGDIASGEKEYEKAVANYLQGTKLREAYFSCYYGLADSYFHLKEYGKTREYLRILLEGLPGNNSAEEKELRGKAAELEKKIPSQP